MTEMREIMQLSDLKTGMIVTTRDGSEYRVLRNIECGYEYARDPLGVMVSVTPTSKAWERLSVYKSTECHYNHQLDIVKVEATNHPYGFFDLEYERNKRVLLWQEEPEIKEVTMSEVEEKFGCKVKIVGG